MKMAGILMTGILVTAGLAWARPEVIFPNQAEVSNTSVISVFQVAELKDLSGNAFNEIAKMSLIENIEDQSQVTLSGEEISKKLRDLVRGNDELKKLNPSFKIPSEIKIVIRHDGLSKIEIEKSLMNFLSAKCGQCTLQIRLNALPKVTAKNASIDWGQDMKYGSFMIPILESNGFSNKWITGTAKVQKRVPVTKKIIRYGERVAAEDLEILDADITFVKEEPPSLEQIVGMMASRTLSPRKPVLLSDLKREPAARRGQIVKALVGDKDFEVSMNASAEENGFVGDMIKIRNPETQKIMSATVIDKGVVKIQ